MVIQTLSWSFYVAIRFGGLSAQKKEMVLDDVPKKLDD